MAKTIYSPEQRRLAALLKQLREQAGLRQVDLAERLGRPQSFISKLEQGQRRLDLIELKEICGVLGVKLADVVRRWEKD